MPTEKKSFCAVLPLPSALWLILFGLARVSGSACLAQEPTEVVQQLRAARGELEKGLVSAVAIGRLRQQTLKDSEPVVSEQDVQIFYDAPKFRVHVIDVSEPASASQRNGLKGSGGEAGEATRQDMVDAVRQQAPGERCS